MSCTPYQYHSGDQIKKKEIGRACSTNGQGGGGEERRIQCSGGETWLKEKTWKT